MSNKLGYGEREQHLLEYIRQGKFTTPTEYGKAFDISKTAAATAFRRLKLQGRVKTIVVVIEEKI